MLSWIFLLLLGALFWFWFDTLRAYEIAKGVCLEMCRRYEVQLLDGTVVLRKTRIYREPLRSWRIERSYSFDFSAGGDERDQGSIVMRGRRMVWFELPGYSGGIISPA